MALYKISLAKRERYYWDEDSQGNCLISAENDGAARSFAATIVQHMNRKYCRIGEPRYVFISFIGVLHTEGFSVKETPVSIEEADLQPLREFRAIRAILEALYPKDPRGKRFSSILPLFHDFKETPSPRNVRPMRGSA